MEELHLLIVAAWVDEEGEREKSREEREWLRLEACEGREREKREESDGKRREFDGVWQGEGEEEEERGEEEKEVDGNWLGSQKANGEVREETAEGDEEDEEERNESVVVVDIGFLDDEDNPSPSFVSPPLLPSSSPSLSPLQSLSLLSPSRISSLSPLPSPTYPPLSPSLPHSPPPSNSLPHSSPSLSSPPPSHPRKRHLVGIIIGQKVTFTPSFEYPSPSFSPDTPPPSLPPDTHHSVYILTLAVEGVYRRAGLATLLVQRLKGHAGVCGWCSHFFLHVLDQNAAAIAFYRKNGFEEREFLENFYYFDSDYHHAFLYTLPLSSSLSPLPLPASPSPQVSTLSLSLLSPSSLLVSIGQALWWVVSLGKACFR